MLNFCLTVLTFRVTFTPLTFCVSRDLKFSLNHNFKQLNLINGILILKVKWKVRWNWCHFLLYILIVVYVNLYLKPPPSDWSRLQLIRASTSRSRAIAPTFSLLCLSCARKFIMLNQISVLSSGRFWNNFLSNLLGENSLSHFDKYVCVLLCFFITL